MSVTFWSHYEIVILVFVQKQLNQHGQSSIHGSNKNNKNKVILTMLIIKNKRMLAL